MLKFRLLKQMRTQKKFKSIEELAEMVKPILENYPVQKAIVFGSASRGDLSKKSDVDMIILENTSKRFFERYEGIYLELNRVLGTIVDLLIYTPEEWEKISERSFIRRIIEEGKIIYER